MMYFFYDTLHYFVTQHEFERIPSVKVQENKNEDYHQRLLYSIERYCALVVGLNLKATRFLVTYTLGKHNLVINSKS